MAPKSWVLKRIHNLFLKFILYNLVAINGIGAKQFDLTNSLIKTNLRPNLFVKIINKIKKIVKIKQWADKPSLTKPQNQRRKKLVKQRLTLVNSPITRASYSQTSSTPTAILGRSQLVSFMRECKLPSVMNRDSRNLQLFTKFVVPTINHKKIPKWPITVKRTQFLHLSKNSISQSWKSTSRAIPSEWRRSRPPPDYLSTSLTYRWKKISNLTLQFTCHKPPRLPLWRAHPGRTPVIQKRSKPWPPSGNR